MKRYRVISELGKGATGVVYRAVRVDDGTTVALKKLVLPGHLDAHQEEEFIARFKSEADAALSMDHPGIVRALDCGLDEGTFYIAYELVEAMTLEEALMSGRKFGPEEAVDFLIQASDALSFAHAKGVVHRDISPGNIFLTSEGNIKITDFGVARFLGKTNITGDDQAIVGTPGYMAPEQVTGGEIDPRSDIFSLGCVIYELLAGKPPFTGESIAQVIHQVLQVQPSPVRDANPKIPLAVEEIVFRMLAKNPSYRYQSMLEVKLAAERVLEAIPRTAKVEEPEDAGHTPYLLIRKGPGEGSRFELLPSVTTIGRVVGDVLLAKDSEVAHQHAWITHEENAWVLYDADSKTGTFVNGEQITREEILPGDMIMVGQTVLEFRGAGGHAGVISESSDIVESQDTLKAARKKSKKKNIPLLRYAIIGVPALLVLALIVFGFFILPGQYLAKLNDATESRWRNAFDALSQSTVGDDLWMQTAADTLGKWQADPLPDPVVFDAPGWVFGSGRIANEANYRSLLFNLAEQFLKASSTVAPANPDVVPDKATLASALGDVGGLEPRINGLEIPAGTTRIWQGRKNQLLGLVRKWVAAADVASTTVNQPATGFEAERQQAISDLLSGWYTYRDAGTDLALLEKAFNFFQTCRQGITPVLDAHANEPDASAVRGLAAFLGAKILRQAGDAQNTERWTRALLFLTDAETDIANTNEDSWQRVIPRDFSAQFPSAGSVRAQINALRTILQNLLSTPAEPEQPAPPSPSPQPPPATPVNPSGQ
jgi:serine/threonine protein kinase